MAWLLPLVGGALLQNLTNKGAAQQNSNSNAASVANASTAWNNAFRRMSPYLAPGAGPFAGISGVTPAGTANYGTPYGTTGGGPEAGVPGSGVAPSGAAAPGMTATPMNYGAAASGGGGAGQMSPIAQMILARIMGGQGGPQTQMPTATPGQPMSEGGAGGPQTGFGPAGGLPPQLMAMIRAKLAGGGGMGGVGANGYAQQYRFR